MLYGGAAGGGKTFLLCLWHIDRRIRYPGTRGMIGRAKISILEQSTLVTLFNVAGMLGYQSGIHYQYNSQKHIINWSNGSTTILKDLFFYPSDPDFNSLGSTEYTDVCIDEVVEVTQKAVEMSKTRIRYKLHQYGLSPKLYMSCNPGPGWVKENWVVKNNKSIILQPHQKFIQALVTDNPDKDFVDIYKKSLEQITNEYDRARLLYGDWEADRDVLNPFLHAYEKEKHESKVAIYDPNKTLYMSIDFNLNPFGIIFGHIWRDKEGEHCHIFDEFSIERGSVPAMIDAIRKKYANSLPSCFLTGDAMGNRGEISQRDNASLYMQLQRGLGLHTRQLKVLPNPTHENSRVECNFVLSKFPDYKINPEFCAGLSRDNKIVQCDAFGSIIKRDRNDIAQRADLFDAQRYFIHSFLREWIYKTMKFQKN